MGDLDCGDCDCSCDDCECDCDCLDCCCVDCNCLDCTCLGNCCTGETNYILCCFYAPPYGDTTRSNHHKEPMDCSICCCFRSTERSSRSSDKSSKNKKRKGFYWRLRSCFGGERSPASPSVPAQDQPKMENVAPKRYNQDGRYPMNGFIDGKDGRYPMNGSKAEVHSLDYEDQYRRRVILDEPQQGYTMDGRWSKPVKHGDQ